MTAADNKAVVQAFWNALYERDWDRMAEFFVEDSEYTDVPSPDDDVAHGPELIMARLRLGLEPTNCGMAQSSAGGITGICRR